MTYAQIQEIEKYINEIEKLDEIYLDKLKTGENGDEYKEELELLHQKIGANLSEYHPEIDWKQAWIYGEELYSGYFDGYKISKISDIMIAALHGMLNALPYYPLICSVREDIALGEKANDYSKKSTFIIQSFEKYNSKVKFSKNVEDFIKYITQSRVRSPMVTGNIDPIYNAIIGRLKMYLTEIPETYLSQPASVPGTQINVMQNATQSNIQTVHQDISMVIENSLKELDDCESVSEDEILELREQIGEIQKLFENKRGNKKNIRERIKNVLKWIADKGTDVMIAILPMLLSILNNIK